MKEVAVIEDKALQVTDGTLPLSLFGKRRTDLVKQGYAILESFAIPMRALQRVWHALNQLNSFDSTILRNLEDIMLSTFLCGLCLEGRVRPAFMEPHFQFSRGVYLQTGKG